VPLIQWIMLGLDPVGPIPPPTPPPSRPLVGGGGSVGDWVDDDRFDDDRQEEFVFDFDEVAPEQLLFDFAVVPRVRVTAGAPALIVVVERPEIKVTGQTLQARVTSGEDDD
jgi:hypothetical protein